MAHRRGTAAVPRFLPRLLSRSPRERDELLSGPLRGELLGADQLAEKAREIARRQRLSAGERRRRQAPLLTRLTQTRRILEDVHARLAAGVEREVDIGPAGEWLLDNFHVVREQIREIHDTLPRGYYRELPELSSGPLAGYPRVYELAITLISHSEARVDGENLALFVAAFQTATPLTLGELWAVPAMLRLALVESVRRMALRTMARMEETERADAWASRIEAASAESASTLGATLDDFVRRPPSLAAAFVSRFLHQLRLTRGSHLPLEQIEQWIADRAVGAEEATSRATQHLALTQVIMAHSITSLREIDHLDWSGFVEAQSATEAVLLEDPAAFYRRMTFATRDRYRHVVERIARRTGRGEADVAAAAVGLAGEAARHEEGPPLRSHVGYYLVDEGLGELEEAMGYRARPREAVRRWMRRHPDLALGGGTALGTALAVGAVLWLAGPEARGAWLAVALIAFIPAFDLAIGVVNQLVTALLRRSASRCWTCTAPTGSRPSSAPWSLSRRCSAAWRRSTRRSATWRSSSSPTGKRTSTSPC